MTIAVRPTTLTIAGKRRWAQHELDLLRREYRSDGDVIASIATRLMRSTKSIQHKAGELGLVQWGGGRPWTATDDAYLEEHFGDGKGTPWLAKRLNRTPSAIRQRLWRLDLSPRDHVGWYTTEEAAALLGVTAQTIHARIEHGALKATRMPAHWRIAEADLKAFVVRHIVEFQGRNVDLVGLLSLLGVR